jgi:hypothetical protein
MQMETGRICQQGIRIITYPYAFGNPFLLEVLRGGRAGGQCCGNRFPAIIRSSAVPSPSRDWLYLEGANFRRIGRVLGVDHQPGVNRVNSYHASLPAAAQPVAAPETLEMDELFTCIGSKKRRRTS